MRHGLHSIKQTDMVNNLVDSLILNFILNLIFSFKYFLTYSGDK